MKIKLTERWEYDAAKSRGFEPLLFHSEFDVDFDLRMEIQRELFPEYSRENNAKFYRWVWDNWPTERKCEETGHPLYDYSPVFISHILSRGANPEKAYDGRNVNLLSPAAHRQWESAQRDQMRIYYSNQVRIDQMREDYQRIKRYRQ